MQAIGNMIVSGTYAKSIKHVCPSANIDVIFAADNDISLPNGTSFDDYDGFILGGSAMNLPNDAGNIKITRQIDLARAAFKSKIPFLGSCWGFQIAAYAAGGIVAVNPRGREVGIARKISLTNSGRASLFYIGKPSVFDSPAIHFDEVTHLPAGSVVLAENSHTSLQAAIICHDGGTFWGMQYHPEFDLSHISSLSKAYAKSMTADGFYATEQDALSHASQMDLLFRDTRRDDLAWLLGIDRDILDPDVRLREVANWIDHPVFLHHLAKH
jgi:GMP synthase (glutamine-hydrolysing)